MASLAFLETQVSTQSSATGPRLDLQPADEILVLLPASRDGALSFFPKRLWQHVVLAQELNALIRIQEADNSATNAPSFMARTSHSAIGACFSGLVLELNLSEPFQRKTIPNSPSPTSAKGLSPPKLAPSSN